MRPFALMAVLYLSAAAVEAALVGLAAAGLLDAPRGSVWLRIHLITLGAIVQVVFGALLAGKARARTEWGIWLSLNVGFVLLLLGVPQASTPLMVVGSSLVMLATAQLGILLARRPRSAGMPFYLAGMGFLLLGATFGMGFYEGWDSTYFRAEQPREVHVHANTFGFAALVFAGLLLDLLRPASAALSSRLRNLILFGLVLGVTGLVVGPWTGIMAWAMIGVVAHVLATAALLVAVVRPLWHERGASAGVAHLTFAYAWFFAPLIVTPFVLLGKVPEAMVGANAPSALIYGWLLQLGIALTPVLLARKRDAPALGGTWWSVALVNAGAILAWLAVFLDEHAEALRGAAYGAWALALVPVVAQLAARAWPPPTALPTEPSA